MPLREEPPNSFRRRVRELDAERYWTEADAAELDLLTYELVKVAFVHRERCATCRERGSCDLVDEAIGAVLEWREGRILRSKAAYLRALESAA